MEGSAKMEETHNPKFKMYTKDFLHFYFKASHYFICLFIYLFHLHNMILTIILINMFHDYSNEEIIHLARCYWK